MSRRQSPYRRYGKRAVDFTIGSLLAFAALPIVAVVAVIAAIVLRWQPFFIQQRVGRGGRPIRVPKLRTLPRTVPTSLDKYEVAALDGEVPAFARFLRRTHLDELPQLLLVPFGRISLVGPRPELPELLDRYPEAFAARRHEVRPGCTGLWQLSTGNARMIYEAPEFDELYVANVSLRLDCWILWRTVVYSLDRRRRVTLDSARAFQAASAPGAATPAAVMIPIRHDVGISSDELAVGD